MLPRAGFPCAAGPNLYPQGIRLLPKAYCSNGHQSSWAKT
nr:MAG TPA: hypothetical protein [Bacteriophage sp.]